MNKSAARFLGRDMCVCVCVCGLFEILAERVIMVASLAFMLWLLEAVMGRFRICWMCYLSCKNYLRHYS